VYVDFAHTPDGLEKVLQAAREFCEGKLWVVFGAGGDRDPMKRPLMGRAAAEIADEVVITSDNPRSEDPDEIIRQVLAGIGQGKRGAVISLADRKQAIYRALEKSAKGDVVIIAGKGHEKTQEIKGVKYPFDDRLVVREYLRA
jgi:UDP-N-acetylmuramoyl-L-alanyl-D-glutamate--2,6-diaminopimelate ligase